MKNLFAYIAGFLDADGSIYVRLKPNKTYKYDFQIAPSVVFFQKNTPEVKKFFQHIQSQLNMGYLRFRKDGIIEYTIGDRPSIRKLLVKTLPFLQLKKRQAKLMIDILEHAQRIESAGDFINLAEKIDHFGQLNYSKKRTQLARVVRHHLETKEK